MDVGTGKPLSLLRAARAVTFVVAAASSAACVRFDDTAIGNLSDGQVAAERGDGGDTAPGQLAPDAAPPAVAGDGGGDAGAPDVASGDGPFLPEAPVDAPAPLVDVAPLADVAPVVDLAPPPPDLPVTPSPPDAVMPPPDVSGPTPATLVVHWKFDERMGQTSADATGNGNTASLQNGANWAEGVTGGAVALGGEDNRVRGAIVTVPAIEAPKSIAFFYLRSNAGGGGGNNGLRTCAAINNPDARAGIQIGLDRGRPAIWQWGQNQGFAASLRQAPMDWMHIGYTYDGSRHRLYIDGVLVDSSVQAPQRGRPTNLLLGAPDVDDVDDDEVCRGRIDEFRVYDRQLSEAEVALLSKR